MGADILVIDDEEDIRDLVSGILEDEGFETRTAASSSEALAELSRRRPSMIFLDIWLQGSELDGLEILDEITARFKCTIPVVMISGHGTIETAVSAIKRGAYDYIEKPFKTDRLLMVAERALELSRLKDEVDDLRTRSGPSDTLIGQSVSFKHLIQTINRISPTNCRVLVSGPAGCGKELVARTIHEQSNRASAPFVILSVGGIEGDMVEQELFGTEDENGRPKRIGCLERAHGGTLYLDEIADMPIETQNKVLRVLIDQQFHRVGGSTPVKVDVRIISSTSVDLQNEIALNQFREDLYHRLAVMPLVIPPLSERRDDIPLLIEHFMKQISAHTGLSINEIAPDAMAILQGHNWPGNARQLRNNIEQIMILTQDDAISEVTAEHLPTEIGSEGVQTPRAGGEHLMALTLREAREIFERDYLLAQIARFGGNVSKTAEFVGMERSALHRKLKSLGVGGKSGSIEAATSAQINQTANAAI